MNTADFSIILSADRTAKEVFDAINNIRAWWSEDFTGGAKKLNEEFEVRFGDVHYSRQKLTEFIRDKKIVWLVTDSRLSFLKDKTEWNGTRIIFSIEEKDDKTQILFTHHGLVPGIECFRDCSNGWKHYLEGSLLPYIYTGTGNPNILIKEIEAKSVQE